MGVEISFLEGLKQRMPSDVELLKLLGDDYTRVGRCEEGLGVDEQLARLLPSDPLVHYNLACSLSLLSRVDEAALALKRSILLGYDDLIWMESDPDLENLRKSGQFEAIATSLKDLGSRE